MVTVINFTVTPFFRPLSLFSLALFLFSSFALPHDLFQIVSCSRYPVFHHPSYDDEGPGHFAGFDRSVETRSI